MNGTPRLCLYGGRIRSWDACNRVRKLTDRLRVIATVQDPAVVRTILAHLAPATWERFSRHGQAIEAEEHLQEAGRLRP
jgi:hypothetical protein